MEPTNKKLIAVVGATGQPGGAVGVKHFVWSTLPDVEAISGGKFHVPRFTAKAKVDRLVKEARFANHTFVLVPFYNFEISRLFA